jgi:mono/diheme cytochrome c family protein
MAGRWKRRLLKFAGYGAGVLVLLLAVGITVTVGWRPFVGPKARPLTERRFEPTPQRAARGKYLVENVAGCFACHTKLDPGDPAGSYASASKRGGGASMEADGEPWLVAPNITPDRETGVGEWTDDQLARAIREGVSRDGRALFPLMPYGGFRNMSDEDLASVVVYLRSVEPVRNQLPKTDVPFPLSRLINSAPEPLSAPVPEPDRSNPLKYGEYLVKVSDCAGCHTPRGGMGKAIEGLEYGGGNIFDDGHGHSVATANITPDPTGISYYDEPLFLEAMKTGHVRARPLSPAMPWWAFRGMNDEDLKAMFAYLRTLKPVSHRIDNAEPPTFCKVCKQRHGLGDRN